MVIGCFWFHKKRPRRVSQQTFVFSIWSNLKSDTSWYVLILALEKWFLWNEVLENDVYFIWWKNLQLIGINWFEINSIVLISIRLKLDRIDPNRIYIIISLITSLPHYFIMSNSCCFYIAFSIILFVLHNEFRQSS